MEPLVWHLVFAVSTAALIWCHAGYPLWLWFRSGGGDAAAADFPPPASGEVSVVIAARNEGARVGGKIAGLLAGGAAHIREIIVVCDHCTDDTAAQAAAAGDPRIRVIPHDDGPPGKPGALNEGVAAATGELIFFTDVRQRIAADASARLAAWFSDPANGAVSGSLEIEPANQSAGTGLDLYWRLEKFIRHRESRLDSSIGCTGAIYMIRRALYQPLPADTILDDVVTPMRIVLSGHRVRFDPDAKAFDPQTLDGEAESRRKIRTLAGNFQMLFRHPQWLLPPVNRLWWELISHKYLRIAAPAFLTGCLAASWRLRALPLYAAMWWAQVFLWALAVVGLLLPGLRVRILCIPAGFLFLQVSVVRGFVFWLKSLGRPQTGWK